MGRRPWTFSGIWIELTFSLIFFCHIFFKDFFFPPNQVKNTAGDYRSSLIHIPKIISSGRLPFTELQSIFYWPSHLIRIIYITGILGVFPLYLKNFSHCRRGRKTLFFLIEFLNNYSKQEKIILRLLK